eukprot:Platyproteum_vivax@DN7708_c0_g1_i1.p1
MEANIWFILLFWWAAICDGMRIRSVINRTVKVIATKRFTTASEAPDQMAVMVVGIPTVKQLKSRLLNMFTKSNTFTMYDIDVEMLNKVPEDENVNTVIWVADGETDHIEEKYFGKMQDLFDRVFFDFVGEVVFDYMRHSSPNKNFQTAGSDETTSLKDHIVCLGHKKEDDQTSNDEPVPDLEVMLSGLADSQAFVDSTLEQMQQEFPDYTIIMEIHPGSRPANKSYIRCTQRMLGFGYSLQSGGRACNIESFYESRSYNADIEEMHHSNYIPSNYSLVNTDRLKFYYSLKTKVYE